MTVGHFSGKVPGFECLILLLGIFLTPVLKAQSLHSKCAPGLLSHSRTSNSSTMYNLVVSNIDSFETKLALLGYSGNLVNRYQPANIVALKASTFILDKLLAMPEVLFADLGDLQPTEELPVPGHNLFVNNIRFVHTRQPGLDGSGTTISVKEFRFDSSDIDLIFHFLPTGKSASQVTPHATIIASLAAGAGNSDLGGRGVARGARLVSSSFVGLLPDNTADYDVYNISVQNHSYGIDIGNYYGALALAYDQSTMDHSRLVHVFSAGNQGLETSMSGPYANIPGFANLSGNFKMAKNVLVVGAVDSFARVVPFSSRGPAYDGRIKPDLVAFGPDGTSGACALVSGAAAVIQQTYFEKYGSWPSSEIVRAVLICSADNLGAPGPDFSSGYGNLNLKKAVALVQHHDIYSGVIPGTGEEITIPVVLPEQVERLKITLCWNDPPAAPNAARALMNDLDLVLKTPDGEIVQPWLLHSFPHPDSLLLQAANGRDSLNTTEQVEIMHPIAGAYLMTIKGYHITTGEQSFAVSVSWDTLQRFEWTCPVRNDPALAKTESILRWETSLTSSNGQLDWKPVGKVDWQSVTQNIDLNAGYFRWLVPDTFTAAQVRMVVDGKVYVSDTFLITPPLRLQIGFNCSDSLLLKWPGVSPWALYQLSGVASNYLEPLAVFADTFIVLAKAEFPQSRFAVSALFNNMAAIGPYVVTPDINVPGIGCYVNTFLALLNSDHTADLTLNIGSVHGVKSIVMEKLQNNTWKPLKSFISNTLSYYYTDKGLWPGTNTYRARLEMENGGSILSEPVQVYFAGPKRYLVLPNPIKASLPLTVISNNVEESTRFFLFDFMGKVVLEQALDENRVQINLPSLATGYYVWQVIGPTLKGLARGKLLVLE